jgi:translation initiation factor eIF-2B subunit epsilon
VTPEARSVGDVMRELDTKQIITSDFVLVSGDIVSTIPLMEVVKEHKERRKISKDCIMTTVMKPCKMADRLK